MAGPVVMTRQGRLEGEQGPRGVQIFRGIPYAAAPVAALRFRAPAAAPSWHGTRLARHFGGAAPQDKGLMQDIGEIAEDCLFLNVWTPACDGRRRPVMFWIHGGGFTIGSGAQTMYEASELALRGDVVVVTINYRLGALGFAHLAGVLGAEHEVPSNLGLRDQIAALGWVRGNIDGFGGDPENVTIFGESAGGMSIGSLLAAPAARGLFRRAIAQSGAAHHATIPQEASRLADLFLRGLGSSAASADKLWSASLQELLVAQRLCFNQTVLRGPVGKRLPQGAMTLLPVGDGDFLPDGPFDAIAAGSARGIDVMTGANDEEWNYFLFFVEPNKRSIDENVLLKIVDKRVAGRGREAIALYRSLLGAELPPWKIYAAIESDRMFCIPALRLAEAHAGSAAGVQRAKTYLYHFDFRSPLLHGDMGSCHALEIPFVFGTVGGEFGQAFTGGGPEAVALADKMLSAWVSFARSGDPNHAGLPEWHPFDASSRATMRLGLDCKLGPPPHEALRSFWDQLQ